MKARHERTRTVGEVEKMPGRRNAPVGDVVDGRAPEAMAVGVGGVAQILALQRLAGNRATLALLRHLDDGPVPPEPPPSLAIRHIIQRVCEPGHEGPPRSGVAVSSGAGLPAAVAVEEEKKRPPPSGSAPESEAEAKGPKKSEQEEDEESYAKALADGVDLLKAVRFGSSVNAQYDKNGERVMTYDTVFWTDVIEEIDGQDVRVLELNTGKKLSQAVRAMFKPGGLKKWSVDCAEFGQIAQWYAMLKAYGPKALDELAGQDRDIQLRPHESSGIKTLVHYRRDDPNSKMKTGKDVVAKESIEELLEAAPVGSSVAWTNLQAKVSDPFRNENTIKLGPDSYAAHGFGKKKVFSRKEIEKALAETTSPGGSEAKIKGFVFVSSIEHFKRPE